MWWMRTGGRSGAPRNPGNAGPGAPTRGLQPGGAVGVEPPSCSTPATVTLHKTRYLILVHIVNGPCGETSFAVVDTVQVLRVCETGAVSPGHHHELNDDRHRYEKNPQSSSVRGASLASGLWARAQLRIPLLCRCRTPIPGAATEPAHSPVTSHDGTGTGAAARAGAAAVSGRVTTVIGRRAHGDFLQAGVSGCTTGDRASGGLRMTISLLKMQTEIKRTEGTGKKSVSSLWGVGRPRLVNVSV